MEASSSTHPQPQTPAHPSLLPALSPSTQEQTPAPIHTLPMHMQPKQQSISRPGSAQPQPQGQGQGTPTMQPQQIQHQSQNQFHQPQHPSMQPQQAQQMMSQQTMQQQQGLMRPPGSTPQNGHVQGMMQPHPHQGVNVFGVVMGQPGQGVGQGVAGAAKVYASVYSGIPVFEAMIRGISVMRRTSDSWVNATQILKVAGIAKSARTKILDKEIQSGLHEKVQGGYGKYQGTWIPFQRGQELAAQYGVTAYLAPIFDFNPSPTALSALPVATGETPDRPQKTPGPHMQYPGVMSGGRIGSPFNGPQFANGEAVMGLPPHPSNMAYAPGVYYPTAPTYGDRRIGVEMTPTRSGGLEPAAELAGMGLPQSNSEVYVDQYGQPHQTFQAQANGDMPPPAKRQKSDPNGEIKSEPMGEPADDEESDDGRDAPPLPASMRLSTRPSRPKPNAVSARTRSKLLALFSADEPINVRAALDMPDETSADFDIDVVIDGQGHTALHWAAALGRLNIAAQLLDIGADLHRGNYAGETPLIRSVLTTNHAETGTFQQLLSFLAPSIRTLDHAHRTVIHHVGLIAGVKGRASSARNYMAQILDWVAKESVSPGPNNGNPTLGLRNFVDVQDVHGDTALNVAARVGNKALVNLLLDAGADKARANKLGLKPSDFGIEVEALWIPPAEAVISNLKSEVPKPERQSRDVQKNISAIFETINDTFAAEMTVKQTALNSTEQSVRTATKALADKRLQVVNAQAALEELEKTRQKTENLRKAMTLPLLASGDDWTGRRTVSTEASAPTAFKSLPPSVPAPIASGSGTDIPLPQKGEPDSAKRLKRLGMWEDRMSAVLEDRIKSLEGETADKAVKYRKLVSLCTKVPVDKVDGSLDVLITAIESDGQSIDLSRIAGFMNRIREQA